MGNYTWHAVADQDYVENPGVGACIGGGGSIDLGRNSLAKRPARGLSHLASGARVIMMAHGVGKAFADRFLVAGAVAAGFVATWIRLGTSGMRIQFV